MSFIVDCSALLKSKHKIEEVWKDSGVVTDYIAEVEALKTIMSKQTARFPDLEDPTKDRTVKVSWFTNCNPTAPTTTIDQCTVGGDEVSDNCTEYVLDMELQTGFNVREKVFRRSDRSKEEVIAFKTMEVLRGLDEAVVQTVISRLDAACKGENVFLNGFTFSNMDTVIPAASWTPELFAYFAQAQIMNRMRGSYLLSGHNLFQANWIAQQNASNANGSGANKMLSSIPTFYDMFNIDPVLGVKKTFLIHPSAVAFVNKAYFPATPEKIDGKSGVMRYSINSQNLPGIKYDVIVDVICEGNDWIYKFGFFFKGGFFCNPASCDNKLKLLLGFRCV